MSSIPPVSTLPEGTLTFLFSDVEGSTRLAKELGDAGWAELLEAHRRILRLAFSEHAGREVDTQGDAFFVVEHLRGRSERAGRLLGAARYLGGAINLPIPFRTPASWALYRHYLPLVREALGPEEARRARDEGRAMTLDDALAYALEGLG